MSTAAAWDRPTGLDLLNEIQLSQWYLPALAVAHRLGILSAVADAGRSTEEAASAAGTDPTATKVLLQMLVSLRVCEEGPAGYRLLDPVRDLLDGGGEADWGPMFKLAWDERCTTLLESVRTGRPQAFGSRGLWRSVQEAAWLRSVFTSAMHARSLPLAGRWARADHWEAAGHLLDVGCGSGVFSRELLRERPGWRATLLDLPEVVEPVADLLRDEGLGDRVDALPGDMFDLAWPAADAVLLSDVLHNWDDDACADLLDRAASAVPADGRVLVHDMLLDDPPAEATRSANALSMIAITGGRQRTLDEILFLLGKSGLVMANSYRTSHYYSVIVARKGDTTDHG